MRLGTRVALLREEGGRLHNVVIPASIDPDQVRPGDVVVLDITEARIIRVRERL